MIDGMKRRQTASRVQEKKKKSACRAKAGIAEFSFQVGVPSLSFFFPQLFDKIRNEYLAFGVYFILVRCLSELKFEEAPSSRVPFLYSRVLESSKRAARLLALRCETERELPRSRETLPATLSLTLFGCT